MPWSEISGMRNIPVHRYFDIDTGIVWDAATRRPSSLQCKRNLVAFVRDTNRLI
jgi:uncharacterized protein with HEPN domain